MASVPARRIKTLPVDYDGEIFASMDLGLPIATEKGKTYFVRPPSFGVWSLLETFESPFVTDLESCTFLDLWRALYINDRRASSADEVRDWFYSDGKSVDPENKDTWLAWDYKCEAWALDVDIDWNYWALRIREWFQLSFNGTAMLPKGAGSGSAYWFGADTLGLVLATVGHVQGYDLHGILWEIPFCAVSHTIAQHVHINNPKVPVSRPKDESDIKEQLRLAEAREERGELHPWQIDEPLQYDLTQTQTQNNPGLAAEYERMREEARGKPLMKVS